MERSHSNMGPQMKSSGLLFVHLVSLYRLCCFCTGVHAKVNSATSKFFSSCNRSFGDFAFKQEWAPLLTSEPFVSFVDLQPGDDILVLGSDGLYDKLTDQQIVDESRKFLEVKTTVVYQCISAVLCNSVTADTLMSVKF